MSSATPTIKIKSNTTWTRKVTFKTIVDGVVTGLINITGYTVWFTVKSIAGDSDANAVLAKTITSHSDPTNGETYITLSNTETDLEGTFFYDIKYKDGSGNTAGCFNGKIIFERAIKRANS